MKIIIASSCIQAVGSHAQSTFPQECCGFMLGTKSNDGGRTVTELYKIDNINATNPGRQYHMNPKQQLEAERYAREEKLEILGVYHSHPNHSSRASEFDRIHALPFWSYLIISCINGKRGQIQSWRLREDRSQFDEEVLIEKPF